MRNRQRVPEYKQKKEHMNIPMTTNQKIEIVERADAKEQTISEYVRDILFPE